MARRTQRLLSEENIDPRLRIGLAGLWVSCIGGVWPDASGGRRHGIRSGTGMTAPLRHSPSRDGSRVALGGDTSQKAAYCGSAIDIPGAFTITANLYRDAAGVGGNMLVFNNGQSIDVSTNYVALYIDSPARKLRSRVADATSVTTSAASKTAIPLNKWVHVCMTYDLANIRLYIDNVLEVTTACTRVATNAKNYELSLGGRSYSTSALNPFSGIIDLPAIWTRVLSDSERALVYGYL